MCIHPSQEQAEIWPNSQDQQQEEVFVVCLLENVRPFQGIFPS